jgi:hypothetical protein
VLRGSTNREGIDQIRGHRRHSHTRGRLRLRGRYLNGELSVLGVVLRFFSCGDAAPPVKASVDPTRAGRT